MKAENAQLSIYNGNGCTKRGCKSRNTLSYFLCHFSCFGDCVCATCIINCAHFYPSKHNTGLNDARKTYIQSLGMRVSSSMCPSVIRHFSSDFAFPRLYSIPSKSRAKMPFCRSRVLAPEHVLRTRYLLWSWIIANYLWWIYFSACVLVFSPLCRVGLLEITIASHKSEFLCTGRIFDS